VEKEHGKFPTPTGKLEVKGQFDLLKEAEDLQEIIVHGDNRNTKRKQTLIKNKIEKMYFYIIFRPKWFSFLRPQGRFFSKKLLLASFKERKRKFFLLAEGCFRGFSAPFCTVSILSSNFCVDLF